MSGDSRVRVRLMTQADLDGVVELTAGLRDAPRWPLAVYADMLGQISPKRIAVVAENEGTNAVIGFAVASVVPPDAELESIAVAAAHQRQGVARRLFATLRDELGRSQVGEVVLEVREANSAARAFYGSVGFAEEGRRPRYYADPVEDAILMRMGLG